MKTGERFWTIFDKTITALMTASAVIILIDALAITIDVLLRYAFSITYIGIFELTEFSLLWMTFLGAAYIMRSNGHVRVDSIVNLFRPKPRAIINFIGSLISMLILIFMTFYCIKLTVHDYQTHFILSGILQPAKWYVEIIIPIGFFILFLQLLRNTYKEFISLKAFSRKEQFSSDSTTGGKL